MRTLRCDSDLAQLSLIRAGAGAGIGICQVALARRDSRLAHVLPKALNLKLSTWMAMHPDLRSSPRCRVVFEALVAEVCGVTGGRTCRISGAGHRSAGRTYDQDMVVDFPELKTARLRLRVWKPDDLAPFAALNADPDVVAHLRGPMMRVDSDALVERMDAHFKREGFGVWAVEAPGIASFIGMVGIAVPGFVAPFTPCVEIAWRLARPFWGNGFASEAARAALRFGFENVGLSEIVALTVPGNTRSMAVMERLGMKRKTTDDFAHPLLPAGHRLSRHVLYRLSRDAWRTVQSSADTTRPG